MLTGATASIKGSANFSAFAAAKFGLRALGQSLAREWGPRGVHVSHFIIDGIIVTDRTDSMLVRTTLLSLEWIRMRLLRCIWIRRDNLVACGRSRWIFVLPWRSGDGGNVCLYCNAIMVLIVVEARPRGSKNGA